MKKTTMVSIPELEILTSPDWKDYELLDSGGGKKLERFGEFFLIRPEAEAIWQPALSEKEWKKAHAIYYSTGGEEGGRWDFIQKIPEQWVIDYKNIKCKIQISSSRHVGIFPEQANHWDWIEEQTRSAGRQLHVLNLFGYTGLASLAAARGGAQVTHVDASRKVVAWARENQLISKLDTCPIRWLVDDAIKYTRREQRRGSQYDGIILDPPKFGRGPKGEVWEFYKLLPDLLQSCRDIFSSTPCFLVLTAYAVKASALTLYQFVQGLMSEWQGSTQAGEIVLMEKSTGRLLPTAIFTRWKHAKAIPSHNFRSEK